MELRVVRETGEELEGEPRLGNAQRAQVVEDAREKRRELVERDGVSLGEPDEDSERRVHLVWGIQS